MADTLDTFDPVNDLQNTDLLHVKRGTGLNSDKRITALDFSRATKEQESKSILIEDPTPVEDLSCFFTDVAITITKIRAVVTGATPSLTWTLRHGTDRDAIGSEVVTGGTTTTSKTTGSEITVFNDATIVADSHVWIETTAQSGTVSSIIITLFYNED
jgi:hypothetical protein